MGSDSIIIATSATTLASSSAKIPDVPEGVSYIVDIIFVLLFLFVLFFVKPKDNPEDELTEEEKPNPLERVLRTDPEDNSNSENGENSKSDDDKKQ